jgi:hypothetical protein
MSEPAATRDRAAWRLPPWLAPREREQRGSGSLRLVETTLLVLLGLLLAVATVNDVSRQVKVDDRLNADLLTWRQYTGHRYHNVGVDQQLLGVASKRDVVCGNEVPGAPKARPQICLVMVGGTVHGHRQVAGGWHLPPNTEDDVLSRRYGCFGAVAKGLCSR